MTKLKLGARILLGLIFLVFGLNGFFQFLPMPPMEGEAGAFMGALVATGYMFPLIKVTEILGALCLLIKRTALGTALLAPVIVNILLFHFVLAPEGLPLGIVVMVLEAFLLWSERDRFAELLSSD